MKNNFSLLFVIVTLLFVACDNEKNEIQTSILTSKSSINYPSKEILIAPKKQEFSFNFRNLKGDTSTLNVLNDVYHFGSIEQPIVMVALFSTWCPPCRGQIPHLSNLQKKFKKNLFILSALVHDDIKDEALKKFIIAEKVLFFLSSNQKENLKFAQMITPKLGLSREFTLPLMILFVNGKYFTHYEGSMPEEMIESDIKQLLKKINQKD
jgi:thiol-disulfide isomerase/thioredoxin